MSARQSSGLSNVKKQRGFEIWKGQNLFFCEGRVIGGPQWGNLVKTSVLIAVPTFLFFIFTGRKQMEEGWYWPMFITIFLYLLTQILLIVTGFTDPGIIPRSEKDAQMWRGNCNPPKAQEINVGGRIVQLKWCTTCKIFRPPRSFHCPICDNCVERFDHHCPWIGNCIGLRNYIYFTVFLWSLFFLCMFVLIMSIVQIVRESSDSHQSTNWEKFKFAANHNPISLFLVCFVFVAMWFIIGLCGFHMFLVVTNKTTNEHLRGTYSHGSPFSRGCLGNVCDICFTLPPRTNVHAHHVPPELHENQRYVDKRVVTYMKPEEMQEHVSSMQHNNIVIQQ